MIHIVNNLRLVLCGAGVENSEGTNIEYVEFPISLDGLWLEDICKECLTEYYAHRDKMAALAKQQHDAVELF